MNKRIKKLAEQAKDHATHLDKIGVDASMEDIFKQKFAELIVRGCQLRVEQYINDCGEVASIPDFVIMKHFGVEK